MNKKIKALLSLVLVFCLVSIGIYLFNYFNELKTLRAIISRFQADSRLAEVVVTAVKYDPQKKKNFTTIKFLEYAVNGQPLIPKYFTFSGNIIQFQALVVRFADVYVSRGDKLKGKSICLFWKVFMLDGYNTEMYEIAQAYSVPQGYQLSAKTNWFERKIWHKFWQYVLDPDSAKNLGIKNAQIEAPGSKFVPGLIYTIKIEHDGGLRIDTAKIPQILRGEQLP